MPTLNWIGKEAVVNHHQKVPFHLLKDVPELSCGDPGSGNLIVQGDNLVALKALLPYYAGQVKCIYIDPPYNTGNEGWAYNDNVNSPIIREWIGKAVGKEEGALDRHDRWLCMMYPRLSLLREFLRDDGAIFISIDDNEINNLRTILDEIFGENNFIAQITLLCNPKGRSQDKYFGTCHEYLLVYGKRHLPTGSFSVEKTEEKLKTDYPLKDSEGNYRLIELRNTHREFNKTNRPNLWYPFFINTNTGAVSLNKNSDFNLEVYPVWADGFDGCWTWGKELAKKDNHLLFGKFTGKQWKVYRKSYSQDLHGKIVKQKPFTIWSNPLFYTEKGQTTFGNIFPGMNKNDFPQPKSIDYICEIIKTISNPGDIIMDSFAGSGTTGHGVLKLNSENPSGKERRFILIEMDPNISKKITAERINRIIDGYTDTKGTNIEGLGGGFRYCELAEPLFDEEGKIRDSVRFAELARHVYFTETGEPLPRERVSKSPLLGVYNGMAVYLLYNGILGDKSASGGNVLTRAVLAQLPPFEGQKVIYCAGCLLGKDRLNSERITVRQTPYEIKVS